MTENITFPQLRWRSVKEIAKEYFQCLTLIANQWLKLTEGSLL